MSAWSVHRWHDGGAHSQHAVVLACELPTKLRLVMISPPVRVLRVEKAEGRWLTPVLHNGAPYPLELAVKRFRRASKRLGVTKGARKILRELSKSFKV